MSADRDRLVRSFRLSRESGCWLWEKRLDRKGYGTTMIGSRTDGSRRTVLAHRLAYELFVGPIPAGLELDHLCRVRSCVNPTHLEAVTHRENIRRSDQIGHANAAKTHCRNGHPFDRANTRLGLQAGGYAQRRCRACDRERAATRRARERAATRRARLREAA